MKNTRTNKNNNTNKKIKIAVIATLTVLTLGFIAVTTAIYLQPAHYKGDTFTNAKTSVSSTTSSTSSSSSKSTTSSDNSDTYINNVYTESNSTEVDNNYSQETNNNQSSQTTNNTTLTEDVVNSYAGWNYQEAIIQLRNNYGITGAVTETIETNDYEDGVIMVATYENGVVYFKIAKHIDTNPYLPVGPKPSEGIQSETGEE